jgi:hypothetical protein
MKTRTGALVASSLLVGSAEGLIGPSKSIQPRKRNSNVVAFATLPDRGSDISASFGKYPVIIFMLPSLHTLSLIKP